MAEKKSKVPAKAKKATVAPSKVLSNKEIVLQKYISADCKKVKDGFVICNQDQDGYALFDTNGKPIHSGLAKTESDAWKLAAHAVL
jgi:hypothetical protein